MKVAERIEKLEEIKSLAKELGLHLDLGFTCLVYHSDLSEGKGCIVCTCGEKVRPHNWDSHRKKTNG